MVLRMKNFIIFGVHWRIRLLGWGGLPKNQYRGGLPRKGAGASRQCANLREGGAWEEKRVVFLRGGDTPMHTMDSMALNS